MAHQSRFIESTSSPITPTTPRTTGIPFLSAQNEPQTRTLGTDAPQQGQIVFRDENDNFFVDGRKIELPEFQELGINETFVPRNTAVSLNSARTGVRDEDFDEQALSGDSEAPGGGSEPPGTVGGVDTSGLSPEVQALLEEYRKVIERLTSAGNIINPNVELTAEKLAEFTKIAEGEINPFFQTQSQLAREGFLREAGFASEDIQRTEAELERRFGKATRQIGEEEAEVGFAQSGRRQLKERELATSTQRSINEGRRNLQFSAGTAARGLAQQFQETPGFNLGSQTLGAAPRVLPGQVQFERPGGESPFFELSDDVFQGLVGTQEFGRRATIRTRTSEQEEAERRRLATEQQRQLTL